VGAGPNSWNGDPGSSSFAAGEISSLLFWILACQGAGFLGGLVTKPALESWYPTLRKPSFTPPNRVFPAVWTLLFLLMAVAAWLVQLQGPDRPPVRFALLLFAGHLLLNVAWSVAFFGMRSTAAGLVEIVPLWISVGATTALFWRIRPIAGILLVPYLLWVTFAAFLNYRLWRLNR